MKDNTDNSIREKINKLDTPPPGISWDKEATWAKIEQHQKAAARKSYFRKGAAWSIVACLFVSGLLYYSTSNKANTVTKEPKTISSSTIISNSADKPIVTVQAITKVEHIQPNKAKTRTDPREFNTSITSPDTSRILAMVKDTVRLSAQKPDSTISETQKTDIPQSPTVDKKLDEDYRLGKVSEMEMILGTEGVIKYNTKERKDKKKKR